MLRFQAELPGDGWGGARQDSHQNPWGQARPARHGRNQSDLDPQLPGSWGWDTLEFCSFLNFTKDHTCIPRFNSQERIPLVVQWL